jgi:hypothetical protein
MLGINKLKPSILILIITILASCQPSSEDDFKQETKAICEHIASNLSTVSSLEDLEKLKPSLKNSFEDLVDLLIQAKRFEIENGWNLSSPLSSEQAHAQDTLLSELNRVLQIDGAQDLIESIQRNSLERLDNFDKKNPDY